MGKGRIRSCGRRSARSLPACATWARWRRSSSTRAPGHELSRVCQGEFADRSLYGRETFVVDEGHTTVTALWLPVSDVRAGRRTLYPVGLMDLLDGQVTS